MDTTQLLEARRRVASEWGDWTAHTIHLAEDLYTVEGGGAEFDARLAATGARLRQAVQLVADLAAAPLSDLRILDLGCLEGLFAIEFARHGAEVVGIEGRQANLEKAEFARAALGLDSVTFVQDDVRNLSVERYGRFDVVLCLGILYHLDAPDVFHFIDAVSQVAERLAVVDTHVALRPDTAHTYRRREYHGWHYVEHSQHSTAAERLGSVWASLDNEKSFWLTRASLFNLLSAVGFTSVLSCGHPYVPRTWEDRDTVVALKGGAVALRSTPRFNGRPVEPWPEEAHIGVHPAQRPPTLTGRVKALARRLLGRGRRH